MVASFEAASFEAASFEAASFEVASFEAASFEAQRNSKNSALGLAWSSWLLAFSMVPPPPSAASLAIVARSHLAARALRGLKNLEFTIACYKINESIL